MKTVFPTEVPADQILPDNVVEELMADDLLPEYDIDYSQARPNRFAQRKTAKTITLDPDVDSVFQTDEAVNTILWALIQSMPQTAYRKTA